MTQTERTILGNTLEDDQTVRLHGNWNFRSHVLSLWSESTIGGTFAPWYFRSLELSFPGTFAPECDK